MTLAFVIAQGAHSQARVDKVFPAADCLQSNSSTPTVDLVRVPGAQPIAMSLKQAVQLALKQNPDVVTARLDTLISRQDVKIARSALLGSASSFTDAGLIRWNQATLIGADDPTPHEIGPYARLASGASFHMPVLQLDAWAHLSAQRRRSAAARFDEAARREAIARAVVDQYLTVIRAVAEWHAVQARLHLATALAELAADELARGTGDEPDALRAKVQERLEQQNLIQSDQQIAAYTFGLDQILALPETQYVVATDELNACIDDTPQVEEAIKIADRDRPDLQRDVAQEKAARSDHDAAARARLPSITFGGIWDEEGRRPDQAIPVYQYAGEMQIPIWTGGRLEAESVRTKLAVDVSKQRVSAQRDAIVREIRTALVELNAAARQANLSADEVQLSTKELTEVQHRFAAGIVNNIEVVTAQNSLAQATDANVLAQYRLQEAYASLQTATGHVEERYTR